MKKVVIGIIIAFVILLSISVSGEVVTKSISAGGDKVRGNQGQGSVNQEGPTPFGIETPSGPSY